MHARVSVHVGTRARGRVHVSNTKFHQNSSSGSRVVPCGQTDGCEANSRF